LKVDLSVVLGVWWRTVDGLFAGMSGLGSRLLVALSLFVHYLLVAALEKQDFPARFIRHNVLCDEDIRTSEEHDIADQNAKVPITVSEPGQ
jgi:hypothetical protein